MKNWLNSLQTLAVCAAFACAFTAAADDDDTPKPAGQTSSPALNTEQQRAVGLRVAHPIVAKAPESSPALGLVLDETALLADAGESSVAAAQALAARSELARLRGLYQGGAGASLKMLEAAEAEEAKATAESRLAAARFAQHWGPVASLPEAARKKLEDALSSGRSVLVRADLSGRHVVGAMPIKAVLSVDGIQVPGRVLGALRQLGELQSAGLLIEVEHPPIGFAAGARVPMSLLSAEREGVLLPSEALLFDDSGAYVYKQVAAKTPTDRASYVPIKVNLILPYGDGWLVKGVDDDDDIVVHGAGVLWSLEGMGAHPVDDDQD